MPYSRFPDGMFFPRPLKTTAVLVEELDRRIKNGFADGWKQEIESIIIRDGNESLLNIPREDLNQIVVQMLFLLRKGSLMATPEDVIKVRDDCIAFLYS